MIDKSNLTCILGIDPGLGGSLAFWRPALDDLYVVDIPTLDIVVNRKKRRVINKAQLWSVLNDWYDADLAVIEDVHSMPQQGVASAFKFGFVAGAIQQAVACKQIPVKLVQPGQWKRHFNLSSDKDLSRLRASELFPKHAHNWPLKKHDGRAEAALLAMYGYRSYAPT